MKAWFLVWAGLWRRPVRTVFTIASLAVGFLLFGLLQGVDSAFDEAVDRLRADRLLVDRAQRAGTIARRHRLMTELAEILGDQLAQVVVVLDDQHPQVGTVPNGRKHRCRPDLEPRARRKHSSNYTVPHHAVNPTRRQYETQVVFPFKQFGTH